MKNKLKIGCSFVMGLLVIAWQHEVSVFELFFFEFMGKYFLFELLYYFIVLSLFEVVDAPEQVVLEVLVPQVLFNHELQVLRLFDALFPLISVESVLQIPGRRLPPRARVPREAPSYV